MKSLPPDVKEMVEEIADKWENMPNPYGSSVIDSALTELATELIDKQEMDVERMDWLEANPEKLKDFTWVNIQLGRLFSFNHDGILGECPRTIREAIDAALNQTEKP